MILRMIQANFSMLLFLINEIKIDKLQLRLLLPLRQKQVVIGKLILTLFLLKLILKFFIFIVEEEMRVDKAEKQTSGMTTGIVVNRKKVKHVALEVHQKAREINLILAHDHQGNFSLKINYKIFF